MKELSDFDQVMFSDLVQKTFDADFDEHFPENGTFVKLKRGHRAYWYYKGYERTGQGPTRTSLAYAGPAADPEIAHRVEAFNRIKIGYRTRRGIATKLRQAGFPSPSRLEGRVLAALAKAGVFRSGVLVSPIACQTYTGALAVSFAKTPFAAREPDAPIDIVECSGISIADAVPDLQAVLQTIDPTFTRSPTSGGRFTNATGFQVAFLAPHGDGGEYSTELAEVPSPGSSMGAPAPGLLDFLIHDPIRSVLLHDAGVAVTVAAPERYAVHKLIVATQALSQQKAVNDLGEAATLIDAFGLIRQQSYLGFAWMEAWERGPRWRRRLAPGALRLPARSFEILASGLRQAAGLDGKAAGDYGLAGGQEELRAAVPQCQL